MAIWILKAVVQKSISFLPGSQRINYLFQKYVTRGVSLRDDWFSDKLGHCADHLRAFGKHGKTQGSFKVFELGTGWFPVVPIGLFLCGADEVTTCDLYPLLRDENIRATVEKFRVHLREGSLERLLPGIQPERRERLLGLSGPGTAMLASMNIRPMIADARYTGLPPRSADLVVSNNVFEHIYPDVLEAILTEFRRIARPGGVMSHFIDMSDHFAHLDKSISIYNFLKYSDRSWKLIDNSVQPMNRMRIYHYREIYRRLGIPMTEEFNRSGDVQQLKGLKLNERFRSHSAEETAISHSLIVSAM
ncbi:MAG: class I SAM-dependent methyltransferase [Bacteroidota bacterium]